MNHIVESFPLTRLADDGLLVLQWKMTLLLGTNCKSIGGAGYMSSRATSRCIAIFRKHVFAGFAHILLLCSNNKHVFGDG